MTFQPLSPDILREHKGKSFVGITTVFFCHDGDGNLLMAKRSAKARDEKGAWEPGSGGLKFGYSAEDNMRRELMEEYGVTPQQVEFLGYWDVFRKGDDGVPTHWLALGYAVLVDRDKVRNNEPDMKDELGWFRLDKLPQPIHSQMSLFLSKFGSQLAAAMQ